MFLRNEPTVLADGILRIMRMVNHLCRLQSRFAGGFVFQNEPTGRGFLRPRKQSFGENEPKLVCLENSMYPFELEWLRLTSEAVLYNRAGIAEAFAADP